MLGQRIVTAVLLLAVLLPALFHPQSVYFNLVALVLIGAAGWEWGKLNGGTSAIGFGLGLACVCTGGVVWFLGWLSPNSYRSEFWFFIGAIWVLGGPLLLRAGAGGWTAIPKSLRWIIGFVILVSAWVAVAQAKLQGINFLLSILLLVWVADIAAFFAGRAWGTKLVLQKLAPTISPGKSWEGVFGAAAGVLILAFIWHWVDVRYALAPVSLFTILFEKGLVPMGLFVMGLTAMSVIGDLAESLVKRAAGAKDSSRLLPGHGGVLDRLDALLPVFPIAMWCSTL